MANYKRGKLTEIEQKVILTSFKSVGVEALSELLNRSASVITKYYNENTKEEAPIPPQEQKVLEIPDAPKAQPKGFAKKHFDIMDSNKPGEKRRGLAIMSENASAAGDEFLQQKKDGLLPMSSKNANCIARAQDA